MFYFRNLLISLVFIGFSVANAGSYEDFFNAVEHDNAGAVQALIQRGFDPNSVSPKGEYGLILAIKAPSPKVVMALLESPDTRAEVRTAQDESALMLAAFKGYLDICKRLIARDADVNKPGWTPLHYAATGGFADVIGLLLEYYAYIDAASPNGSTPLMMAAMYGNTASVKTLLAAGADPAIKNSLGLTALDFAQRASRPDAIELISAALRASGPKASW